MLAYARTPFTKDKGKEFVFVHSVMLNGYIVLLFVSLIATL